MIKDLFIRTVLPLSFYMFQVYDIDSFKKDCMILILFDLILISFCMVQMYVNQHST